MMQDLSNTQMRLEADAVTKGAERYMNALERDDTRGRTMDSPVAEQLLRRSVRRLSVHIGKVQSLLKATALRSMTSGGRLSGHELRLQLLSSDVIAYLIVKTCVSLPTEPRSRRHQTVAARIGEIVNQQIWYDEARAAEARRTKGTDEYSRFGALQRQIKAVNPRAITRWMRELDDLVIERWSKKECIRVGGQLLDHALPIITDVVESKIVRAGKTETKTIVLTESFSADLQASHASVAMNTPWMQPMVVTPRPWVSVAGKLTGGYLTLASEGLKSSHQYTHTEVDGIPDKALRAINLIQSTRWAINERVLAVAQDAFAYNLGPTPYSAPLELPPSVSSEVWESLDKAQRGEIKNTRAVVYHHNAVNAEKKLAQRRAITVAEGFVGYDAIYFPHAFDWRTRVYPLPQDLNPQVSDFGKGLLHFADAYPLGAGGVEALACVLADHYGLDKATRGEKLAWVKTNEARISKFARNPWGDLILWDGCRNDNPWQFLSVAIEFAEVMDLPASEREAYESHVVAAIDGTCNGLQHLNAIALCPDGGASVNLTQGPRRDIYVEVSETVAARVALDAATNPAAAAWLGNVTRSTVKQPVMCKPYGVTSNGIRDQLLSQPETARLATREVPASKLVQYLVPVISQAIESRIPMAQAAMVWLKACAGKLAKHGEGITWMTPLDVKVTQRYTAPKSTRVKTLLGNIWVSEPDAAGAVKVIKQQNSIVPNVVHSLDAAHLLLTVLSCEIDEPGMAFAMVHDSFGTHIAHREQLAASTRENFAAIYRDDWFALLSGDFTFFSNAKPELPAAPARGELDINDVLNSESFFC